MAEEPWGPMPLPPDAVGGALRPNCVGAGRFESLDGGRVDVLLYLEIQGEPVHYVVSPETAERLAEYLMQAVASARASAEARRN